MVRFDLKYGVNTERIEREFMCHRVPSSAYKSTKKSEIDESSDELWYGIITLLGDALHFVVFAFEMIKLTSVLDFYPTTHP